MGSPNSPPGGDVVLGDPPIWTLTGSMFAAGTAIDNTQTDLVGVFGGGNSFLEPSGNLILYGGNGTAFGVGWDTSTSIVLGGTKVIDSISLNGGGNSLVGNLSASVVIESVAGNNGITGGNSVTLTNSLGITGISLGGANDSVTLNGNAANAVLLGGANGFVQIGSTDDGLFGYSSSVALTGSGNVTIGGDEALSVTGGSDDNLVVLGDGNNSVTLTGAGNIVVVGGGNNTISVGGGLSTIAIVGIDGTNPPRFVPDADDSSFVTASPTDDISIAGSQNFVTATYENVNVFGQAASGANTVTLGDGNNTVLLGGVGSNSVTLGNGDNLIDAAGNDSFYQLGAGADAVTLSGSDNSVLIEDARGVGTDVVTLGTGQGNLVNFAMAGGSVTGTGGGVSTTTVVQTGTRGVTVNLGGATAIVSLGDGDDAVTANGASSTILLGNGNDKITADGNQDLVMAGAGNDSVTANGDQNSIILGDGDNQVIANGIQTLVTVGNGKNTITANGSGPSPGIGVQITAGSGTNSITANGNDATVTVGMAGAVPLNGDLTLSATGSNDTLTVTASDASTDNITVGNNALLSVTNGTATITGAAGDSFVLNGLNANSVLYEAGNDNLTFLGSDSCALIHLNPANTGDVLTMQGDPGNTYAGAVEISGFGGNDQIDLQGLVGGVTHADFGSLSGKALLTAVLANMRDGPTGDTLALAGGGSIKFDAPVAAFTVASFASAVTTGPLVLPS